MGREEEYRGGQRKQKSLKIKKRKDGRQSQLNIKLHKLS